jgi:hypothetical protein
MKVLHTGYRDCPGKLASVLEKFLTIILPVPAHGKSHGAVQGTSGAVLPAAHPEQVLLLL